MIRNNAKDDTQSYEHMIAKEESLMNRLEDSIRTEERNRLSSDLQQILRQIEEKIGTVRDEHGQLIKNIRPGAIYQVFKEHGIELTTDKTK